MTYQSFRPQPPGKIRSVQIGPGMKLHREDLEPFTRLPPLERPGLYFHSRCHPQSSLKARYHDGLLYLECAECSRIQARLVVASEQHNRGHDEVDIEP